MTNALRLVIAIGIICCVLGVALVIRGELTARRFEAERQRILASYPSEIAQVETELRDVFLPQEKRAELEKHLEFYKMGRTGIPRSLVTGARETGYVHGGFVTLIGIFCISYALMRWRLSPQKP